MLRVTVLVRLPRILFLNAPGVREHQLTKVFCPRRAEDAPFVALSGQPGKVTDMVQMRVRENNGIKAPGLDRKIIPVSEAKLFQSLEQSTIEQDPFSSVLEKVFGTSDRACGTEKCEFCHVVNDDIRVFRDLARECRVRRDPSAVVLCPAREP